MKEQQWPIWIILVFVMMVLIIALEIWQKKDVGPVLVIAAGPQGSSAANIAGKMTFLLNREMGTYHFTSKETAGSQESLERIDKGLCNFALASAEEGYKALVEEPPSGKKKDSKARLMVRLFGSYVQLIVLKYSPVTEPSDLSGKRVAIGNPNSTTAVAAKRYFQALNIWPDLTPIYVGYELALQELISGSVDAVWLMSGIPCEAVRKINRSEPLRLISPWEGVPDTPASRQFYQDYPFYDVSFLPPRTYRDQKERLFTIGMATLWFADRDLDSATVRQVLEIIYTEKNLEQIRYDYPAAQEMRLSETLTKMILPMHPGAVTFLREHL